ncbi:MAG: hypothetical protein KJO08_07430 [Gammaproteobacteria bacterium]|nr:hypothetical protein [Gammaproteobacteria bacterium]
MQIHTQPIDIDHFLTKMTFSLQEQFADQVGICQVHRGMLGDTERETLKQSSPAIYNSCMDVLETEYSTMGAFDMTVQLTSFILVYDLATDLRDRTARKLAFQLLAYVHNQRWGIDYAHPAQSARAFDLHGLLRNPDTVVGDQGWSPTLQARAGDLFGDIPSDKDPQFSIWAVLWEQKLRGEPIETATQFQIPGEISTRTSLSADANREYTTTEQLVPVPAPQSMAIQALFSERGEYGRRLEGVLVITPPDRDAVLVSHYLLFWGTDAQTKLADTPAFAEITHQQATGYRFPENLRIPRGTRHVLAYGKNPQSISASPVAVPVTDCPVAGQSMENPRQGAISTIFGEDMYVAGGQYNTTVVSRVEFYSPLLRQWQTLDADLPADITGVVAAGVIDEQFHLLGRNTTGVVVLEWSLTTQSWQTIEAFDLDGEIQSGVCFGGGFFFPCTPTEQSDVSQILIHLAPSETTSEQQFTLLSSEDSGQVESAPKGMGFQRTAHGLCATGDRIYWVGGQDKDGNCLDQCTAYYPKQKRWEECPTMPEARKHVACALSDGRLYVLGGQTADGKTSHQVESYDLMEQQWETHQPMNIPRSHATANVIRGNLYLTGGVDENGVPLATTEIYLPYK